MCAICLVAISVVAYFMYTKVASQNSEMLKISKRCEAIEMLFAKPPSPEDLQSMYKPKYAHDQKEEQTPQGISHHTNLYDKQPPRSPPCDSAMCDLEPLNIDTNEDDLDFIVNEEVNKIEQEKASPKRKMGKRPSSKKNE